MLKKTSSILITIILLIATMQIASAAIVDADIAKQFIYPTGNVYCSLTADTLRSFDDERGNGFMFGDTTKKVVNAYVIFVDFPDCVGSEKATYGDLQNVFSSSTDKTGGYVYDYSKPETFVNNLFYGSEKLDAYAGTPYEGLIEYFQKMSYGNMTINPIVVNAMVKPNEDGSMPWFRLPKAQKEYAIQFASGVEDYRALGRLHQAAIDIAYDNVTGLDMSDADFLFTIPPINTHGSRSGLAGGDGIDTAFSFQDQWLLMKGTEYEHAPSVTTHEGRIIGSAVSVSKNTRNYGGDSLMYRVIGHETSHGLGLIDNYTYEGKDHHAEGWDNPVGSWGLMSSMTGVNSEWFAWDKFKAGWIADDQVETVLPGTTETTIRISALGSNEGDYAVGNKMVLLPTELRTIDTFNSDRNPNRINFNLLDYFIPVWKGGAENAEKTFPTGYVLESRRAVGVDENNNSATPGTKGVLITQLSNLTWETGHGGAGFKVIPIKEGDPSKSCLAAAGSGYSNNSIWEDKARGIKIEVVNSTAFYDDVKITYTGIGKDAADEVVERPYQGDLSIDDNYITSGSAFKVNFNIKTRGVDATDGKPIPTVVREGSPLGVSQGIASYKMAVTYDPKQVAYVDGSDDSPFSSTYISDDGVGNIVVTGSAIKMIEGNILSLDFKSLSTTGSSIIGGELQNVGLLNYEGKDAIVDGVKVKVTGGHVVINPYATYSVSGKITGSVKSAGIDATLQLIDSNGENVGPSVRSLIDGTYTIPNIPTGTGYKIKISRYGYNDDTTRAISVTHNLTDKDYELQRSGYTVTGKITGDNSPLAGAIVQLKDFGAANVGSPVTTKDDGTYFITNVPYGRMYSIHADLKGSGFGNNKSGLVNVYDNAIINLDLTSTYTVSGTITPENATAESSATVQLKDKDGKNVGGPVKTLEAIKVDSWWESYYALPYIISNVPKGDGYTIEITSFGYSTISTTPFNVVSYNITDKDLALVASSGHSGGSSTSSPVVKEEPKVNNGKIESVTTKASNGVVQTTISDDIYSKALKSAPVDGTGTKTVVLDVKSVSGANSYKQTLPTDVLSSDNADSMLSIVTDIATLQVPSNMFANSDIKTDSISLSIGSVDKSKLNAEVVSKIGDRPVIELKAFAGNSNINWSNESAPVKVSFKYKPISDEEVSNKEFITVWYIDGSGKAIPVTNSRYDAVTGEVSFTTTHFSIFAVAYEPKTFSDLKDVEWARHSIEVMASKGAIYGLSDDLYNPKANITRADFMKFLVSTLDLHVDFTDNFADISKDAYYYNAAGIAKKLGIINGVGEDKFDPLAEITRQDIMVMTARALKISKGLEEGTLSDLVSFADSNKVSDYAKDSVIAMIKSGIVTGSAGNIYPTDNTTRAEAAVIMYRLFNK